MNLGMFGLRQKYFLMYFLLISCIPTINEKKEEKKKKTIAAYFFFSALQKKVLIPSIYFANYSKSKNFSIGKVYMKRFESACMTILVLRLYR